MPLPPWIHRWMLAFCVVLQELQPVAARFIACGPGAGVRLVSDDSPYVAAANLRIRTCHYLVKPPLRGFCFPVALSDSRARESDTLRWHRQLRPFFSLKCAADAAARSGAANAKSGATGTNGHRIHLPAVNGSECPQALGPSMQSYIGRQLNSSFIFEFSSSVPNCRSFFVSRFIIFLCTYSFISYLIFLLYGQTDYFPFLFTKTTSKLPSKFMKFILLIE
ncbi:hypothetical protein SEVIR_3G334702v4 [Setaria viridis]